MYETRVNYGNTVEKTDNFCHGMQSFGDGTAHPKTAPRTIIRPMRGSIGSLASIVPSGVSLSSTSRASISGVGRERGGREEDR